MWKYDSLYLCGDQLLLDVVFAQVEMTQFQHEENLGN